MTVNGKMQRNEKGANRNLLPILHQLSQSNKTSRPRAINGETYERKRTRKGTRTRTKHDLTQPKTAGVLQHRCPQKGRQKTHLRRQRRNHPPNL